MLFINLNVGKKITTTLIPRYRTAREHRFPSVFVSKRVKQLHARLSTNSPVILYEMRSVTLNLFQGVCVCFCTCTYVWMHSCSMCVCAHLYRIRMCILSAHVCMLVLYVCMHLYTCCTCVYVYGYWTWVQIAYSTESIIDLRWTQAMYWNLLNYSTHTHIHTSCIVTWLVPFLVICIESTLISCYGIPSLQI